MAMYSNNKLVNNNRILQSWSFHMKFFELSTGSNALNPMEIILRMLELQITGVTGIIQRYFSSFSLTTYVVTHYENRPGNEGSQYIMF